MQGGGVQLPEAGDQRVGDEEGGLVAVGVVQGALQGVQHHDADAHDDDDGLDEVGLARTRAGEAGLAARLVRPAELADGDEDQDAQGRARGEELDEDVVGGPVADDRQQPVGAEELAGGVDEGDEQGVEADRHEPVRDADDAPAVHPGVGGELPAQRGGAPPGGGGAQALGGGGAQAQEAVDA